LVVLARGEMHRSRQKSESENRCISMKTISKKTTA
jgi:hypothetical protein